MQVLNQYNYMKLLHEKAFAKINLSLKVLNIRNDGYHNIKSHVIFANIFESNLEYVVISKFESNQISKNGVPHIINNFSHIRPK